MDAWNTTVSFWDGLFSGAFAVSFREGTLQNEHIPPKGKAGNQWLFPVPLKGGRWHIIPQLAVYTTYIPLIVLAFWGVICYRSHLLGEPETTIEERHRLKSAGLKRDM